MATSGSKASSASHGLFKFLRENNASDYEGNVAGGWNAYLDLLDLRSVDSLDNQLGNAVALVHYAGAGSR